MNIKNPIVLKKENGELAIAKKYDKKEEYLYKSFMTICATYDDKLVDTKDKDEKETMKACAMQYDKMRPMMNEVGKGGLTEKQKKLPPALQKAILKKMKEDGKLEEDKEEEKEEKSDAGHGLWHNIQIKKQRMGKNYRPAKPGDKDRPTKEALKKAQKSSKSKASEKSISALKEIAGQLDNASALHKSQANRIREILKTKEEK